MRLLLDTHIWIWSYLEPHKISSEVTRELTNPGNDRLLSAGSVWEAIVLLEKKRIQFKKDFGEGFRESKEEVELNEVPATWDWAPQLRFKMLGHRDPPAG